MLAAVAVIAICASPLVLVLWLLNRRDRRRTALWNAIGPAVRLIDRHPDLAGAVAVWVEVGLGWRARVTLDVCHAEGRHVWALVERLTARLPPRASLRVITASRAVRPPTAVSVAALGAR